MICFKFLRDGFGVGGGVYLSFYRFYDNCFDRMRDY